MERKERRRRVGRGRIEQDLNGTEQNRAGWGLKQGETVEMIAIVLEGNNEGMA